MDLARSTSERSPRIVRGVKSEAGAWWRDVSSGEGGSLSVVAIPAGLPWPVWLPENRGGIVGPGFSTKIHQECSHDAQ